MTQKLTWDDLAYATDGPIEVDQPTRLWQVPEGENPLADLETVLLLEGQPIADLAESAPASLRPPNIEGKCKAFEAAVSAYVREMQAAGWPELAAQEHVHMGDILESTAEHLEQIEGNLDTHECSGDRTFVRTPLLLNTWLGLLHQGHVAVLKDEQIGGTFATKLVIQR